MTPAAVMAVALGAVTVFSCGADAHAGELSSAGRTPQEASVSTAAVSRYRVDVEGMVEFLEASPAGPSGDVWRTEVGLPFSIPLAEGWRLAASLSAGLADFESVPYEDDGLLLWDFGTFASLTGSLAGNWTVSAGGFVSSSFEDGAGMDDSVNGGGGLAFGYRWSPRLSASLGALYIYQSFGDSLVVPNIRVDWQISEALSFSIAGLKTTLKQKVDSDVALLLAGEFAPGGGKLKDRRSTEARQFEDRAFRFGAGVEWSPADNVTLTLLGGVALHEVTLRDAEDRELSNDSLDPAPYVSLKLTSRF